MAAAVDCRRACQAASAPITRSCASVMRRIILLCGLLVTAAATNDVTRYSVSTHDLSRGARDSFPLGNGDFAANVWVANDTGIVHILLSKSDSWDIYGRLLKIGKLTVEFSPSPFESSFEMRLDPQRAEIVLSGDGGAFSASIIIDANHPVLRFQAAVAEGHAPVSMLIRNEGWRTTRRLLKDDAPYGTCRPAYSLPDVVMGHALPPGAEAIGWYHRSEDTAQDGSAYRYSLRLQGLTEGVTGGDPLAGRTFGATVVGGSGVLRASDTMLKSEKPGRRLCFSVVVLTAVTASAPRFLQQLSGLAKDVLALAPEQAERQHLQHWAEVWNASYIDILADRSTTEPAAPVAVLSRALVLERFMMRAMGRGPFPIRFNGGLFTFDNQTGAGFDADFRGWGDGFWFQNTRQPYWSALASDDLDLFHGLWATYQAQLPLLTHRTRTWFGHDGLWIPETSSFWGTYMDADYGCERAEGSAVWQVSNPWIRWHRSSTVELVQLMLDYYLHSQDHAFARTTLLPWADQAMAYVQYHYAVGLDGRLTISPASALETYQSCVNPTDMVAGLHALLPALLGLPSGLLPDAMADRIRRLLAMVPDLPIIGDDTQGRVLDAAGAHSAATKNKENVALYAIWPFGIGGHPNRTTTMLPPDVARRTFDRRPFPANRGWAQDIVDAALLGLRSELKRMLVERLTFPSVGAFPAFWAQTYDYAPEVDHGETAKIAAQHAILQADGQRLLLLAGWPREWDVDFRLAAPNRTTVEGAVRDGQLTRLVVTPPERERDVVNLLGVDVEGHEQRPQEKRRQPQLLRQP